MMEARAGAVKAGGGKRENVEAPTGFEPVIEILQTSALPLGDGAPSHTIRMDRRLRIPLEDRLSSVASGRMASDGP
jgi:hypothetical protein